MEKQTMKKKTEVVNGQPAQAFADLDSRLVLYWWEG